MWGVVGTTGAGADAVGVLEPPAPAALGFTPGGDGVAGAEGTGAAAPDSAAAETSGTAGMLPGALMAPGDGAWLGKGATSHASCALDPTVPWPASQEPAFYKVNRSPELFRGVDGSQRSVSLVCG